MPHTSVSSPVSLVFCDTPGVHDILVGIGLTDRGTWTSTMAVSVDSIRQHIGPWLLAEANNTIAEQRLEISRLKKELTTLETVGSAKERDEFSKALDKFSGISGRVRALEAQVARLTADGNGFPMETFPSKARFLSKESYVWLRMGGEWVKGGYSTSFGCFYSHGDGRTIEWDRANQPTAWKPI